LDAAAGGAVGVMDCALREAADTMVSATAKRAVRI